MATQCMASASVTALAGQAAAACSTPVSRQSPLVSFRCPVVSKRGSGSALTSVAEVSRREAVLAGLAGIASFAVANNALAGEEEYKKSTKEIIDEMRVALSLDKKDPEKEPKVTALLKDSTSWVAAYRRDKKVAGRPSYGNVYSAINAIAGHYNNFGPTYPIPKKRQDRIFEELADAEKQLTRGR